MILTLLLLAEVTVFMLLYLTCTSRNGLFCIYSFCDCRSLVHAVLRLLSMLWQSAAGCGLQPMFNEVDTTTESVSRNWWTFQKLTVNYSYWPGKEGTCRLVNLEGQKAGLGELRSICFILIQMLCIAVASLMIMHTPPRHTLFSERNLCASSPIGGLTPLAPLQHVIWPSYTTFLPQNPADISRCLLHWLQW